MNWQLRNVCCAGLALGLSLLNSGPSFGQEKAAPKAGVAAKTPGKAGGKADDKSAKSDTPAPAPPKDPAAISILESNPATPAELVRAIDLLLQLDEAPSALPLIKKLGAAKPNAATSQTLIKDFGSGVFLKMAMNPDLQPDGKIVSDTIVAAAEKQFHDPAQIKKNIAALTDSNSLKRRDAKSDLRAAQSDAAVALIGTLADPAKAAQHASARDALVALDGDAVQPLIATLDSSNDALRLQAMEVLGRLKAHPAVPLLAGLSQTAEKQAIRDAASQALLQIAGSTGRPGEVQKLLQRNALEYFDQRRPLETNLDGKVKVWRWDGQKKTPVVEMQTPQVASANLAARSAKLLAQSAPEPKNQHLALAAQFEAAAISLGLDKQLSSELSEYGAAYEAAKQQSPEVIEATLQWAVQQHHPIPATVAARLLSELGKANLLTRHGNAICPVAAALRSEDRRLRFAALQTIMAWNPDRDYAGSSFLPETLGFFASGYGVRKVLIAHPTGEIAQQLGGIFSGLGYDFEMATNGRDALRLASASPDFEMFLVSTALDHMPMELLVGSLHNEPRTASVPVAVLLEPLSPELVKRFALNEPNCVAVGRPHDEATVKSLIAELEQKAAGRLVGADERMRQSGLAIGWLSQLSSERQKLYDLRRQEAALLTALDIPPVALEAAKALGQIGTHEAQVALVELASRGSRPLNVRMAAAAEFGANVRKYGLRLTRAEILRQYDRYNQSEKLDAGTQQALATVLDWIEAPGKMDQGTRAKH